MPGGDGCELMGGFLGGEYTPEQRVPDWPEKAEVIVDGQHEIDKPVIRDWPLGSGWRTRRVSWPQPKPPWRWAAAWC